jgi:hypothetical protein
MPMTVLMTKVMTVLVVRDNLLEVFRACNLQPTESISYR